MWVRALSAWACVRAAANTQHFVSVLSSAINTGSRVLKGVLGLQAGGGEVGRPGVEAQDLANKRVSLIS